MYWSHRCGWGSGALFYAEMLPNAKVTAFSNSKTQKQYIDDKAKEKGLNNLKVITGNVVDYEFEPESFDRVVSIEVSSPPPPKKNIFTVQRIQSTTDMHERCLST